MIKCHPVKCTVEICTVLNATSEILNSSSEKTKQKMLPSRGCLGNEIRGVEKAFSGIYIFEIDIVEDLARFAKTTQALGKPIRRC